ncbi:hypothetical protein S11_2044 [Escherichia coli B26-1]|nr:hypothetical protein S11_2044 [Escherichia coli B26-1]
MKFCAGATFITGFNGSGYSDCTFFLYCLFVRNGGDKIKTLLILFYLITDLRVNKSLPLLAYKNEIGCLLRNCFKDLPGFRYYPGE